MLKKLSIPTKTCHNCGAETSRDYLVKERARRDELYFCSEKCFEAACPVSVEVGEKDCYIEYKNGDSDYVSFHRASKIIRALEPISFRISTVDNEKSVNFINKLTTKYAMQSNRMVLK